MKTWRIPLAVWVLLAVVLLAGYATFMFHDLLTTYDNSIVLLLGTYHGRSPLEFYDYSIDMVRTPYAANYNFPIYILWALWNAPALLACKLCGADYLTSAWGHLWAKTLLVLALLAVAFLDDKLLRRFGADKSSRILAFFLLMSSPIVYTAIFIEGGIDILSLVFMLLGILLLVEGRQLGFLLCFLVATPFKMFALFISLPLLLLVDKNVVRVLVKWLSTAFLLVVEKLLFAQSPAYHFSLGSQSRDAIGQLLYVTFTRVSVFLLVLLAAIVFCYLYEGMEGSCSPVFGGEPAKGIQREQGQVLLYVCLVIFGTFVVFVPGNNYWSILYMPFFVLACALARKDFVPVLVALETVGSFAHFFGFVSSGSVTLNEGPVMVNRLFLPHVVSIPSADVARYASPQELIEMLSLDTYKQAFLPLFAGCMIIALVLACPRFQSYVAKRGPSDPGLQRVLPWMRVAFLVCQASIILYAYTATTNPLIYTNLEATAQSLSANLVEGEGHELRQEIRFDHDATLDTLVLRFDNPNPRRFLFSSVTVELRQRSTDETLWQETLGVSLVEGDVDVPLSVRGVKVAAGEAYDLLLVGHPDIQEPIESPVIHPYIVNDADSAGLLGELSLDGAPVDGVLQFSLR